MSSDSVIEDVPVFVRRYGDYLVQGSNNTIIIMGTDRARSGPSSIDDGLGHISAPNKGRGTGTIHIISGRKQKDPDLKKDESFVYITRKSRIDENLELTNIETSQNEVPGIVVKSDVVRVVGRKDLKFCANDDEKHYLFMDQNKVKVNFNDGSTLEMNEKKITIKMGNNSIVMDDKQSQINVGNTKLNLNGSLVTIDSPTLHLKGGCESPWDSLYEKIISALQKHDHVTPSGPSGPASAGPVGATGIVALTADKLVWKNSATE
jgi:hypothetical protein